MPAFLDVDFTRNRCGLYAKDLMRRTSALGARRGLSENAQWSLHADLLGCRPDESPPSPGDPDNFACPCCRRYLAPFTEGDPLGVEATVFEVFFKDKVAPLALRLASEPLRHRPETSSSPQFAPPLAE